VVIHVDVGRVGEGAARVGDRGAGRGAQVAEEHAVVAFGEGRRGRGVAAERVAVGRLDDDRVGAGVDEQARGPCAGDAGRDVEHPQTQERRGVRHHPALPQP
jgi:hypothetical protein